LTETSKALKRNGIQVDRVSEKRIREIFMSMKSGELTKEAIPDIVSWLSKHENRSVKEAISSVGLEVLSKEELEKIVDKAIRANKKLIEERGMNAFGVLMGVIMKEVRGRANAGSVSELIRKKLEQ